MDCKEFEKLIPDFIARKLDYPTLKRFSEHMESCGECKEELTIQFLVTEGIHRLEDGNAFDLQAELELRLSEARQEIRSHSNMMSFGTALELIAAGMLLGIAIWIIL